MATTDYWGGYYYSSTTSLKTGEEVDFTMYLPDAIWNSTFSVTAIALLGDYYVKGEVSVGPLSYSTFQTNEIVGRNQVFDIELHAVLTNIGIEPIDQLLIHVSRVGP